MVGPAPAPEPSHLRLPHYLLYLLRTSFSLCSYFVLPQLQIQIQIRLLFLNPSLAFLFSISSHLAYIHLPSTRTPYAFHIRLARLFCFLGAFSPPTRYSSLFSRPFLVPSCSSSRPLPHHHLFDTWITDFFSPALRVPSVMTPV